MKVRFCRYVDDFRLFAPDAKTAHAWLTLLVERLHLEGLTINPSKTSIIDVSHEKKVKGISEDFKKVATELRQSRIIVGYTGTIPTKFRELSKREIQELREEPLDELEKTIKNKEILQPDDIKRFLRIIVAKGEYGRLCLYRQLIEKIPQFTPLVVDLFIKKETLIPAKLKDEISEYFSLMLSGGVRYPEYMLISIVKLLGKEGYQNNISLMEFFRSLKRNSGAYVGRAVLDALDSIVSRTDVLEIRQYYTRADMWEKRAIIKIVNGTLSDEEKRPWLKNVKNTFNR